MDTPVTVGPTWSMPSTWWLALSVITWAAGIVRVAAVVPSRASKIVPPFSVSAFASTLIPRVLGSVSESVGCTT